MPCSDDPLIGKETETYKLLSTMLQGVEEMKSPRVIKSHLPLFLLPSELLDKAKVYKIEVILNVSLHSKDFFLGCLCGTQPKGCPCFLLSPSQTFQNTGIFWRH